MCPRPVTCGIGPPLPRCSATLGARTPSSRAAREQATPREHAPRLAAAARRAARRTDVAGASSLHDVAARVAERRVSGLDFGVPLEFDGDGDAVAPVPESLVLG